MSSCHSHRSNFARARSSGLNHKVEIQTDLIVRMITAVTLLPLLLQIDPVATQGGIKGQVVDASGGAISAAIRVVHPDSNALVLRLQARENGSFETSSLAPGVYSLTAYAQGFRRRELQNIVVSAGHSLNLGQIMLDLAGCDAPGITCDYIGGGDPPKSVTTIVASGSVTLTPSCAVDLDRKPTPVCPAQAADLAFLQQADLRVARENGTLFLVAVNGATLCKPDAATSDCSGVAFGNQRLNIVGTGPGVDFCVKTKQGSVSHVFFTHDIERDINTVALWYVTREAQ